MSLRMSPEPEFGDSINVLPTDQTTPTHNEIQIVDTLFKQKQGTVTKLLKGAKEFVLLFLLFIAFSLPQIDSVLRKIVPDTDSPYILVGVKGVLFVVIYFLIKNLYLVRKNN